MQHMWLQEDILIVNEDGPSMLLPTILFCFLYFVGVCLCSKVLLFESDPFGVLSFVSFGVLK